MFGRMPAYGARGASVLASAAPAKAGAGDRTVEAEQVDRPVFADVDVEHVEPRIWHRTLTAAKTRPLTIVLPAPPGRPAHSRASRSPHSARRRHRSRSPSWPPLRAAR